MPHVAGHEEGEPVLDFTGAFDDPVEPRLDFSGAFGVGQGRTEQKYVAENNSIVNVPFGSPASLASRESKELIEGQEGFFGNTPIGDLLGAPGGIIGEKDFRKFLGGIIEPLVTTITGGFREEVILSGERQFPTPRNIGAALIDIEPLVVEGVIDLSRGDFRDGVSKLVEAFGRARQVAPPNIFTAPFELVKDFAIQKNPEIADLFNEKMLELQAANEEFLIRNDLMFGPDDEPTIVGNLVSQLGLTAAAIGGGVVLKSPAITGLVFGLSQQVSGFQEAEEAGKDPFTASAIGTAQGTIEFGVMFVQFGVLTKVVNSKSASILKKIAAGFITEGIEEGVTEALIASVQNITGVRDMTLNEALITIFQAIFYGALAGGGVTGSIATVQRLAGGTQENVEKIVRVMDNVASDTFVEVTEQITDDVGVELDIGRDIASDQPVTKSAKTTDIQQKRVVEILQAINKGEEINIQEILDEANPEARIQRQKQKLEEARTGRARTITKEAVREAVVDLQARIQIAEQQGNEEEAARLSEEIDTIQQRSFGSASLREAVEELEAEGVFVRGSELLERAVAEIDDVLRPLRAGVRVGRVLQKEETKALQDSLTQIVRRLKGVVDPNVQTRLQEKVRAANTVKSAERIRRDILSLARKSGFRKFIRERRKAIDKTIISNTSKKKADLAPDFQNSLDRLNKMRKGMDNARGEDTAIVDFNTKQGKRIASDMDHGIPPEGVMLQVRYLDILNQRVKVTPEVLARFEDDLNAFIASGKGEATSAQADQQAKMDQDKAQVLANDVKTTRAEAENSLVVDADVIFGFLAKTYDTEIIALAAEGTVFDMFDNDIKNKTALNDRGAEIIALADSVSEGEGAAYLRDISHTFFSDDVIDLPREGLTKSLGGSQSKNIKMTRGQLIYSWMILQETSIREQLMNPKGEMAWTPELVAMIETRITPQDEQFAIGLFEFYERSYARLNEVYRKLNNRDLLKVEFYSHLRRAGEEGLPASVHNETMFNDLIVGNEENPSGLITGEPAEVKKRQLNAVSEIKIDNVLNSFARYNYDVEHYIAYAEDLVMVRKMLTDKEFVRHAQEILGKAGYLTFTSHLKLFARQNISAKKYMRWIEKFRQFQFKSTLLANPKIGIGQLSSISAWAANMPKGSFAVGISSYAANPDAANEILNRHATFRNRELNFDPDIDQLGEVGSIFKWLSLPIRKGDAFAVRSGAWARYKWLVDEKGVDADEALAQVARFAERSQQSVLASQRTLAQKSDNPIVRAITMYKSSLTAMLNVSMQSIIRYKQADTSTPQKKSEAREMLIQTLAVQNLVIPATFAFLTGGNIPRTILVGSLAGVAGLGEVLEVIAGIVVNIFADEDDRIYVGGVLDVPADAALETILRELTAIEEFGENVLDDGFDQALEKADIGEFMEALVDITDIVTPLPITNLRNVGEGISEVMGLSGDDRLEGILKALGYKTQARERMLKRIDAVTGSESRSDSDRILTQGAF